jgi:hypothetical protein
MDQLELIKLNIRTENLIIKPQYTICDIVLGGGGFRSYYHLGFFTLIKELVAQNKIKPRYLIGTSSGAISAVYHACGIDDKDILSTYDLIKNQMNLGLSLHDAAIHTIKQILPPDAHTICSGKVQIYVSVLGWSGFYPMYINHFATRNDLIQAISASINIPYLTTSSWLGIKINGSRCYDGLFTAIVPSFPSHPIPQLAVSTHRVLYPKRHTLNPGDSHIYLLGLRGLIESYEFFNGQTNPNSIVKWIHPFANIGPKKSKSNLYLIIPGLMWIWATICYNPKK